MALGDEIRSALSDAGVTQRFPIYTIEGDPFINVKGNTYLGKANGFLSENPLITLLIGGFISFTIWKILK